ncbi:MAG: lipase maturation factor family protein [Kofleriaceae bacterium]|nr:lipase maturation factor family protein [Kofleriaceae bacterium]
MEDVPNVRAPDPLDRLVARIGPPRDYTLTRWLVLRLLGLVYVCAFIGLLRQGPALWGEHGLTPVGTYLEQLRADGQGFWDVPSVLWFGSSDGALSAWAWIGLVLSVALLVGYANTFSLLALWAIYGSFVRTGQLWFSFGWEIQILETTVLAAFLAHAWDPRPLKAPPPSPVAIALLRWLVLRIMLGAGLIKLRGDTCWTDMTCLDYHFETQPIPNPLSAWFHHLPTGVLHAGVVINHIVEIVLPLFVFGPRRLRLIAGVGMALFQGVLILSGNLAFLNWLTLVPILACFDDEFLRRLVPARLRAWLVARTPPPRERDPKQLVIAFAAAAIWILVWGPIFGALSAPWQVALAIVMAVITILIGLGMRPTIASPGQRIDGTQLALGCLLALVAIKSVPVVGNLLGSRQAMNRSYDRLALVNTYGAFGSVGDKRYELVIEGTRDLDPTTATWQAYELPCKPGDLARRPCILGPYHLRLDWLIWFAAMHERPRDPWVLHMVYKLLAGDRAIRTLLAVDPFHGEAPTFVRIRRFQYHLQPLGAPTWWTRDHEELWLRPRSLEDPELHDALARFGWPSPPLR